jgi:ribosomal protein S18 acetylase RimI-like enzyme
MFERIAESPLETGRPWATISDLYVRPTYRRRGTGKKLLQACFDDLRRSGTSRARILVWSKNESAIGLYREVGFGDCTLTLEAELGEKQAQ